MKLKLVIKTLNLIKIHGIPFGFTYHCKPKRNTMKKNTHEILDKIRELILSEDLKNASRSNARDFTRNCRLTFPRLLVLIINLVKRSAQCELNKYIKIIDTPYISKQAFFAARKKLLPKTLLEVNNKLINEFYTDNDFSKFMGYRLIVVDGSTLQLPDSLSIREKFGACGNQYKADEMPMARISYAYDPLNGLTLDAILSPYVTPERNMAYDHVTNIQSSNCAEDLFIFDRGYPSITLIFFLLMHRKNFVMRTSTGWISEIKKILKTGKNDVTIEITPRMIKIKKREHFRSLLKGICLKTKIKIRVIVIDLPTGEKEILITSLIEGDTYKYEMFKSLYNLRWGGEENYKFHKIRIEIENFSGESPVAVEQDFYANLFTANVISLLARESQEEAASTHQKIDLKHAYKINQNVALGLLKDEIVNVLLNPKISLIKFCNQIKDFMKKSVVSVRPGRTFKRRWKNVRKYAMNARRAL